jgi:hypothetical protein
MPSSHAARARRVQQCENIEQTYLVTRLTNPKSGPLGPSSQTDHVDLEQGKPTIFQLPSFAKITRIRFSGGVVGLIPEHLWCHAFTCLSAPLRLRASLVPCSVRPVRTASIETRLDIKEGDPSFALQSVLRGRPILSIVFDNMEMSVEKPTVVASHVEPHGSKEEEKRVEAKGRKWAPAFGALGWGKP